MPIDRSNLNLRITETPRGEWFYAVYTNDGTEPGSLLSASSTRKLDDAIREGALELQREIIILACDHDWVPWGAGRVNQCTKCKIVDWTE